MPPLSAKLQRRDQLQKQGPSSLPLPRAAKSQPAARTAGLLGWSRRGREAESRDRFPARQRKAWDATRPGMRGCPSISAQPRLAGTLSGQVLQICLRKTQEKRDYGKLAQAVIEAAGGACGFLS